MKTEILLGWVLGIFIVSCFLVQGCLSERYVSRLEAEYERIAKESAVHRIERDIYKREVYELKSNYGEMPYAD